MIGVGVFIAIPASGTFGVFWTLFAVVITGYNVFMAVSDEGAEREIYVDESDREHSFIRSPLVGQRGQTTVSRLNELESLRAQDLITEEEYAEKRLEILRDL